MKRCYKTMLIVMGVISVFSIFLCIISTMMKGSSIGIIGGADGPTSILIAENSRNRILLFMGTGIFIITFIIVCIVAMKKK